MSANLVFLSADVLTMDPHAPRATAVAMQDGIITAVGADRDVSTHIGPRTRVVECQGKCLVPGFHDAHLHLLASASRILCVDCGPQAVTSIGDIQNVIRRRAEELPAGTWIRAGDYDESLLAEKRHPTRWDLDIAAPLHPVRLQHRSHHACVLNSLALRQARIEKGDPLATKGLVEVDGPMGEPTGLLYDMQEYLNDRVIPPVPEAELRLALEIVFTDLLSKGITSVQDAGHRNGLSDWLMFHDCVASGEACPRITLMIGQGCLTELAQMEHANQNASDMLRVGPVKIMLTESGGDFDPGAERLFECVWEAHQAGYPVAIHAVEESAVCLATEAIASALDQLPRPNHGHRLEHASIAPPVLLDRMAEKMIGVVTQPGFLYYSGDRYLAEVDDHLRPWLYPLRSILDRGLVTAAGSDAPVAPADPLRSIWAAVTRCSRRGQVVGASERVSVEQALSMHTIGPARILGRDARLGSITTGKLADLTLLEENPLRIPAEEIKNIKVEMTVVQGNVMWER